MKNNKILSFTNNNMRKHILILTLAVFSLGLYSCGGNSNSEVKPEKKLTLVKVKTLETQYFEEKYSVVGVVKPFTSAKLSSEEGGVITYLGVDKGSRVGRGQVVVRLNKDTDVASYEQSKAQYELAKSTFERIERLYNDKIATESQYTDAKLQLDIAERTLNVFNVRLSKSYVTSPISGVVDAKYMNIGEMTAPGAPILNIVDISRVKVTAGIPERYLGNITKGESVKITFDVFPNEEFSGIINFVSPVLNQLNRTYEVEVTIQNPQGRLKPEMSANLAFTLLKVPNAIVLEQDLIVDNGDEKFVFVVEGNVAKKRVLKVGATNNNMAYIESGLNAGDRLVNVGFQYLADNDTVDVAQ
ncbi:MAG TPA: efflux RND transporter periplasmic adaptor subunit [Ignavibacteria bacterium]|nr:efflux RND transporter periplasmic adaptor subunit [Ignavibacteria bacterium]